MNGNARNGLDGIKPEYILEIAHQKSISKAAARLFVAQPSLSRYLINLENQLGVKLFDRSHNPLELTEAGNLVVQYIQQSEALKENLLEELGRRREIPCAEIRIGIVTWRIPVFVPKIIPEFIERHHNVNVTIREGVSQDLEALVLKGLLDACVINGAQSNALLEYRELHYEKIVLAVPRHSAVARKHYDDIHDRYIDTVIDLQSVIDEPFILLNENYRLGQFARRIFKSRGIHPTRVTEVANMNTALSMSAAGLGLTFVAESAIERGIYAEDPPLYFSIGEPEFGFPLVIAFKRDRGRGDYLDEFIEYVCHNYNALNDGSYKR